MPYFQNFQEDISGIELPSKFTFPFYYEPHPLTIIAARELQAYLENQTDFEHNFGIGNYQEGMPVGKMFGVLVVQNQQKEVGYLVAVSGKLTSRSLLEKFVPLVYDFNTQDSFYAKGQKELIAINQQIETLEKVPAFIALNEKVQAKTLFVAEELKREKEKLKSTKKDRQIRRKQAEATLNSEAFLTFDKSLAQESITGKILFKKITTALKEDLLKHQKALDQFTSQLAQLKTLRKNTSNSLQHQIFANYQFLNQQKTKKRLTEIFPKFKEQRPSAGTGDCSAPKLLQYAFLNDLKPIAMGEFWWGASPSKEIRKHKHFYPACGGRCKPILAHMLEGIDLEENPFLQQNSDSKEIDIIFEDDALIIINKPAELLSVPGKNIIDSVYTRIKALYPTATGPLIVHRLDMSTSGILVLTKTKEAHKGMQMQFVNRTLQKRYVAVLEGTIEQDEGYISLPLRVDLNDRPRQLVCYEHGKPAKTRWKVIERVGETTRIHLYPITGRTHQLRVHLSHPLGLNTPIIGDDLYGKKANRLHLHAAFIAFIHPISKKKVSFTIEPDF